MDIASSPQICAQNPVELAGRLRRSGRRRATGVIPFHLVVAILATPSIGLRPVEALTSRRSQSTRVGHTDSFRRRITRLDRSRSSASTQRHLTSATQHERALTRRELALRAVAAVGADRPYRNSQTTEAPRGLLLRRARPTCRGRLARRGHHLAPRPALGCATRRSDEPCGRSSIARTASGSAARCASTWSASSARRWPLRSQDGAASLELIQQQQVIVAGQRGVIMRGRRGSRYRPPARRGTRTSGVARHTRRRPHVSGQTDESMLALVRLLARQAAREAFDLAVAESDRSVEEGRE